MHDSQTWSLVAILLSFVLGIGSIIVASWLSSQRAEKSRVDVLENRVAVIEERDKHTPSAKDVAPIAELTAEVRQLVKQIDRLHDRFGEYERAIHREASAA